jgi:hypothetical protein
VAVQDRDVFYIFGSICKMISGKVAQKDWKLVATDIWAWSQQAIRNFNGTSADVPNYPPPTRTLPPPPTTNIAPVPSAPSRAEKPIQAPTPPPQAPVVYLDESQTERLLAHCHRQGMTQEGVIRYFKDHGVDHPNRIPLAQARDLWNHAKEPTLVSQYQ